MLEGSGCIVVVDFIYMNNVGGFYIFIFLAQLLGFKNDFDIVATKSELLNPFNLISTIYFSAK